MKIKVLSGVFLFLVLMATRPGVAFSQKLDEVFLRNGSIIRGKILTSEDTTRIRIHTLSENILVFSAGEVVSVSRSSYRPDPFREIKSGYQNITGIGLLAGSGMNERDIIFVFSTINGYRFGGRWFAGAGTGLEFFEYAVVPVTADVRYYFVKRKLSNYFHLKTGYNIPLQSPEDQWGYHYRQKAGWGLGAGIGADIHTNDRNAIGIEFGYRHQKMITVYTTDWQPEEVIQETRFNRFEITFALKFR